MKEFLSTCKSVVTLRCQHKAQLNYKLVANTQKKIWKDLNFVKGFTV